MGKWSYSNGELTPEHYRIVNMVKELSDEDLYLQWMRASISGRPEDYFIHYYSGISGDGWACADNSSDTRADKVPFLMSIDRRDFLGGDPEIMQKWNRRICLAAHLLGVKPYVVEKLDSADAIHDSATKVIPTGFGITSLNHPDLEASLSSNSAMAQNRELDTREILDIMRESCMMIFEFPEDIIFRSSEEHLKLFVKKIRETR